EFTLWVESDLVDVKGIFKKLALLEYCFGPLPTGHGAFENMVRVVNETLQKTLAGLSSPDQTITEDTTGVGDGHTNSLEFWSKGFYLNFYGKQMDPHRTLTTIIHEASHRFAKTKDSWGDNSYVDIKWDIYWQVHGVNIKGTAHRPKAERPKPGMGSTMYPPITEHDKGLLNADSYATFAVRLFEV